MSEEQLILGSEENHSRELMVDGLVSWLGSMSSVLEQGTQPSAALVSLRLSVADVQR